MTRTELIARIEAGGVGAVEYVFFWKHTPRASTPDKRCMSQWSDDAFDEGGVRYPTAEHWMMASKARLFGDDVAATKILAAAHPKDVKALGRTVKGFDAAKWDAAKFDVVVAGNRAKFGQSAALRAYLVSTGDAVLVEASPLDTIWGIGLGEDSDAARDPRRWRGANLLGFALMMVRDELLSSSSSLRP